MGIEGLLKLLDPVTQKEHISSFRQQTAAIDIMSWLYKGCYRCAYEHNQNIETNAYLYYIFEMLEILSFYKIKPIVVFDGRYVGKKDQTIEKRKKMKEENRQRGLQCLERGLEDQARKYLSRCIIIDDKIITLTMRALHTKGVQYMVAPYQSDSQISKLIHLGMADFAITEDSDLILYGVKVVLKLTQDGECDHINLDHWKPCEVDTPYLKVFLGMDAIQRVEIGVLAGSDYNQSIKGIGIKRAIKHLSEKKSVNNVIQHLREHQTYKQLIPEDYQAKVLASKLIFTFATVYNPLERRLQFFNPSMLEEIKPEDMDLQDLKKIVGIFYEYDEDYKKGIINAKTKQQRDISKINIKEVFSINSYSLEVRQKANQKRREIFIASRKRKEEERANMQNQQEVDVWKKTLKPRKEKVVVPEVELTEEEKKKQGEQRKADRLNRFSEFKNILNSFMIEENQSDSPSVSSQIEEKNKQNQKVQESNKKSIRVNPFENEVESLSDSNDNSIIECLGALNPEANPWLKR